MTTTASSPECFQLKSSVQNGLSEDLDHPLQNLKIIYFPAVSTSTVAHAIILCSQHNVLVIQMEFSPKHYYLKVSLLLTRKEKSPKCQEIPICIVADEVIITSM